MQPRVYFAVTKASQLQERLFLSAGLPLVLLLAIPILALILRGFDQSVVSALSEVEVRTALWISLKTCTLATLCIAVFGLPLAVLLANKKTGWIRIIDALIDVPVILPPAVAGLALLLAFGRKGLFGSYLAELGIQIPFTQAAVVLAQIFVAAPFFIKTAAAGIASMDPEMDKAAALDGASFFQRLWHIMLPLSWNFIFTGLLLSWTRAMGEFGATILFAGNLVGVTQTMPLAIYLGFESNPQQAIVLAVILLGISLCSLTIAKLFFLPKLSTS